MTDALRSPDAHLSRAQTPFPPRKGTRVPTGVRETERAGPSTAGSRENASGHPAGPHPERRGWVTGAVVAVLVLSFLAPLGILGTFPGVPGLSGSSVHGVSPAGQSAGPVPQCDGVWANVTGFWYDPSYCYGHDEAVMNYWSHRPGSGANATFQVVLPSDGTQGVSQAQLYATFWFGGVVRDPNSLDDQAFLEFQFYPAPPYFTGPGSGTQDCLPNGAFNPVYPAPVGANRWFACAVVWQVVNGTTEDAAFAGPLNQAGASDQILEMQSGDHLAVTYSGIPQSATQGWHLSVNDLSRGTSGAVTLQNGSLALSPYYATASPSNVIIWGAAAEGAISFAYEIGHQLDPTTPTVYNEVGECFPGDGMCSSYWPGKWNASGQMQLDLPVMGDPGDQGYPRVIGFSSSQGGETEVNDSSCVTPSFSTLRNCMYPFYQYRDANTSFTFGTTIVPGATHTYGNEYQFPAVLLPNSIPAVGALSTDGHRNVLAPWGTLTATVAPANARVDLGTAAGLSISIPLGSNGSFGYFDSEFMEGTYWLNVSAPGCLPYSHPLYLGTGAVARFQVILACGTQLEGVLNLTTTPAGSGTDLNASAVFSGGAPPYTATFRFGDGTPAVVVDGAASPLSLPSPHLYHSSGTFAVVVYLNDSSGQSVILRANVVSGSTPFPYALESPGRYVRFFAQDVAVSGTSLPSEYPMTTLFPQGQGDIAASYLLPGPVSPVTWTFTLNRSVSTPLYLDPSQAAYVHFYLSVGPVSSSTPVPGAVPLTVLSQIMVGGTNVGMGAETLLVPPTGTVEDFNVSLPILANVTQAGYPLVTTVTWYMTQAAGENVSWQVTIHSGQQYPIRAVLPLRNPVDVSTPTFQGDVASAQVLSPFGPYDLARVEATFQNATLPLSLVSGSLYSWTLSPSGLPPGRYPLVVTGTDHQGVEDSATGEFQVGAGPTYPVNFTAESLPNGTPWSLSIGGTTYQSFGTSISVKEPNGTWNYSIVSENASWRPVVGQGSVAVAGASVNQSVLFAEVESPVTFVASGLPTGTVWGITLGSERQTTNSSQIPFSEPNGTYAWTVEVPAGYAVSRANGTLRLPGPGTVNLTFVSVAPGEEVIAFTERGLPDGTPWGVELAGVPRTSNTSTILFAEANGTYGFTVDSVPGYDVSPQNGTISVAGARVNVSVVYTLIPTYPLTFRETGLPSGLAWSITVDSVTRSSNGTSITFLEPNGTYTYSVTSSDSVWSPSPSRGSVTLSGTGRTISITFVEIVYAVTFSETGLPAGRTWSVALSGHLESTNSTEVGFGEPNGSYSFSVYGPSGYSADPASGQVQVNGSSVFVQVEFRSLSAGHAGVGGGGPPAGSSAQMVPGGLPLAGGAATALGGAGAVLLLRKLTPSLRRRRALP